MCCGSFKYIAAAVLRQSHSLLHFLTLHFSPCRHSQKQSRELGLPFKISEFQCKECDRPLPCIGALNLFGGILFQKRRAEKALEDSGLQYVIVRPGGMERPTDDYKLTHNVRLATRDTLFGGLVSRLQVAELVSAAIANPSLTENKVTILPADTSPTSVESFLQGETHL